MKRRLAALALAATMVVGSGMTVSAAPNITDMAGAATGQEVEGTGTIELPTIKVTVPTTADIVINPYQMKCTVDGKEYSNQIICVPQDITNESNVAVAVNVSDLTTKDVPEGIAISTSALTAKTTTKSAFLYLEVTDGEIASAYDAKSNNQVVIPNVTENDTKTKKGAKEKMVVLAAGDEAATKAQFTIGGAVVANPTKVNEDKTVSSAPWESTDKFNVSFKFTFTPQVITE